MIGFVLGVLIGFGAKMAYDFFQEERIPTDLGMAQGRAEAMMDETRQIVREIRDELRSAAVATKESVADKAGRLQGVASTPPPQGTNPPAASTGAARSGPSTTSPSSTTSPAATAAAPETFGAAEAGPTKGSASSTTGASASPPAERTSTESSGTAARSTSSQSASTHDRPDNGGSSKPSGQSKKDGDD